MTFDKPIETPAEAIAFIQDLSNCGKLFHFDDPIDECFPEFSKSECAALGVRVDELFKHFPDPFEVALYVHNK